MGDAWRNWYHCTGGTYGAWVRGDPRGWRARHHREHVEGDYKRPPPHGKYLRIEKQSRALMRRERVVLDPEARDIAVRVMVEAFHYHRVEVVALCVGARHWHALLRFRPPGDLSSEDRDARKLIGIAKKRSAQALSDAGLVPAGGVWGVRFRIQPVKDRAHQVNITRYIHKHAQQGAAVWSIFDQRKDTNPPSNRKTQGL